MTLKRTGRVSVIPEPLTFDEIYDLFLGAHDRWLYRLLTATAQWAAEDVNQHEWRAEAEGEGYKANHHIRMSTSRSRLPNARDLEVFDWLVQQAAKSGRMSATFDLQQVAADLGRNIAHEDIEELRGAFHGFFALRASVFSEVKVRRVARPHTTWALFGFLSSLTQSRDDTIMDVTWNSAAYEALEDWPMSFRLASSPPSRAIQGRPSIASGPPPLPTLSKAEAMGMPSGSDTYPSDAI